MNEAIKLAIEEDYYSGDYGYGIVCNICKSNWWKLG